jgi:hypothetical protein
MPGTAARPIPPRPVDSRTIPALHHLTEPQHNRWVAWQYDWRPPKGDKPGKWINVPKRLDGGPAPSNDRTTWSGYSDVWRAVQRCDALRAVLDTAR